MLKKTKRLLIYFTLVIFLIFLVALPVKHIPKAFPKDAIYAPIKHILGNIWSYYYSFFIKKLVYKHAEFSLDSTNIADLTSTELRLRNSLTGEELWKVSLDDDESFYAFNYIQDGKKIITSLGKGYFKIWDSKTGLLLSTLNTKNESIQGVNFSPDEKLLVTKTNRLLQVWDAKSFELVRSFSDHMTNYEISFNPSSQLIVTDFSDEQLKILDIDSGETIRVLEEGPSQYLYNQLLFSPDSKTLAASGSENVILLWNLTTGRIVKALHFSGSYFPMPTDFIFNSDGRQIAAGYTDGSVRIWDIESEKILKEFNGYKEDILSLSFSPDESIISSVHKDGSISHWNIQSGKAIKFIGASLDYSTLIKFLSLFIPLLFLFELNRKYPLLKRFYMNAGYILRLPIEKIPEAKRHVLHFTHIRQGMADIGISIDSLETATKYVFDPIESKANTIASKIGARYELLPLYSSMESSQNISYIEPIYKLTLPKDFLLNIDYFFICFPIKSTMEELFTGLSHNPDTRSRITLIVYNDSSYRPKLFSKTGDISNKWVALDSVDITRLLLSMDADAVLAEILSKQLSLQQISPYRIGGGVSNESVFFGRRELIAQIINRDPTNYLMAGGRQVGKSTLLKAIERRYTDDPQIKCVYLTLSSEVLVPRLASLIKLEHTDQIEELASQLDKRIQQTGQRYLFLIDEADRFIEKEKFQDYAILNVFRRLSEEGKCNFILTGFWQLYQHAILDYQSPIRNFGELLSVEALERTACIDLATKPMQTMNLSYFDESLPELIVDSCGQRANLIAITCQYIVCNLDLNRRIIEANDVHRALHSNEMRRALSGWVVGETDAEQTYDRMIVYSTINQPSFSIGELLELTIKHGLSLDTVEVDKAFSRLELSYVLKRIGTRWFYRVPLFVDYIAEDSPELKLQAELSRIDQYG